LVAPRTVYAWRQLRTNVLPCLYLSYLRRRLLLLRDTVFIQSVHHDTVVYLTNKSHETIQKRDPQTLDLYSQTLSHTAQRSQSRDKRPNHQRPCLYHLYRSHIRLQHCTSASEHTHRPSWPPWPLATAPSPGAGSTPRSNASRPTPTPTTKRPPSYLPRAILVVRSIPYWENPQRPPSATAYRASHTTSPEDASPATSPASSRLLCSYSSRCLSARAGRVERRFRWGSSPRLQGRRRGSSSRF